MQWIDPHKGSTFSTQLLDEASKIGEVADTPVALRPQAVELHGRAPTTPSFAERRRAVAPRRRDREYSAREFVVAGQRNVVISPRQRKWQREIEYEARALIGLDAVDDRRVLERRCAFTLDISLACDSPLERRAHESLRQMHAQSQRTCRRTRDGKRWKPAPGFDAACLRERVSDGACRARVDAHRAKN